jgi:isovaleryl-CoA dehydrogenase
MRPFPLGEDLDLLRESVHAFAEKEIAPRADRIDRENLFPEDLWRKFGDMGLLAVTVPEEYGGSGLGYLAHLVAMEEISRASGSVGLSYGAHSNLCVQNLYKNGNEAQRRKYLPRLASGEWIGALAMSEPSSKAMSGSPTAPRCGSPMARMPTCCWSICAPRRAPPAAAA